MIRRLILSALSAALIWGVIIGVAVLLSMMAAAQAACPAGRPAPAGGCGVSDLDPVNTPGLTDQTFWCQPSAQGCKATDPVVTTKQISFGTMIGFIRQQIQTAAPLINQNGVLGLNFDSTLSLVNGQLHAIGGGGGGGITQLTNDVLGAGTGAVTTTVVGLQGRPLSSSAPASGQCLGWNGTQWVPVACGTVSGLSQGITLANACTGASCAPAISCLTFTNGPAISFATGACGGGGTLNAVARNGGGGVGRNGGGIVGRN